MTTTRDLVVRREGVAALPARWRGLAWAAPVVAMLVTGEVVAGGANSWALRPAASLANLLVAGCILLAIDARSRFWSRIRLPWLLCLAALAWALWPRLLSPTAAALLEVPSHPAPDRLWPELADMTGRVTLLLAGCAIGYRTRSVVPLVRWLVAAGGVYGLAMILDDTPWTYLAGTGRGRFAATIGNWNAAGVYFGMVAVLGLGLLQERRRSDMAGVETGSGTGLEAGLGPVRSKRLTAVWPVGVMVVALLLCVATASRSAFTLTMLALVVGAIWNRRMMRDAGRAALVPVAIAGAVAFAIAWAGSDTLFPRYRSLSADGLSRWDILSTYLGYAGEAPLWGFGPGSFFDLNQARLTPATAPRFWNFGAAHNAPVQIVLEAGWPALLLLGVAGVAILRAVLRQPRTPAGVGLVCALVVLAGASMVDIAWNVPAIGAMGCVMLGVAWGSGLRVAHAPPSAQQAQLYR